MKFQSLNVQHRHNFALLKYVEDYKTHDRERWLYYVFPVQLLHMPQNLIDTMFLL